MSRQLSWKNTADRVVNTYKGEEPLASFLKKFFAADKKYGSGDRKEITRLCYDYFRSKSPQKFDSFINTGILSDGMEINAFRDSFLEQPDLFLRIRPGYRGTVIAKLTTAGVDASLCSDACIRLPNTTKLEGILEINKEVVVQDMASQLVSELMRMVKIKTRPFTVWDCCAGSGGKSILATDILGDIDLTVSDVRKSILSNLEKRFMQAGIKKYKAVQIDLSTHVSLPVAIGITPPDLIIADVPCTGSGTWSRTPEQLFFFKPGMIQEYASLQANICTNAWDVLKPGGYFLYITCSVFRQENEDQVAFLIEKFHAELMSMELINCYLEKADTLFAAILRKPL